MWLTGKLFRKDKKCKEEKKEEEVTEKQAVPAGGGDEKEKEKEKQAVPAGGGDDADDAPFDPVGALGLPAAKSEEDFCNRRAHRRSVCRLEIILKHRF